VPLLFNHPLLPIGMLFFHCWKGMKIALGSNMGLVY
jgi:hypothetical protein